MSVLTEIKFCEESLLHLDVSKKSALIDELLSPEFEEISPVGVIVSREKILTWLYGKDPQARWQLDDFKIKMLNDELVLATYQAKQILPIPSSSKGSLRSSIWRRHNKNWQMIFHQATKIL